MFIEWKDAYMVGVGSIDAQHRQLIAMLNRLYESMGPDTLAHDVWGLLSAFDRYAETHFASEERIARESHISPAVLCAHHDQHEAYRERMVKFRLAFERNDRHAPVQLLAFLSRWWLTHILVEDMELGRQIQEQERLRRG